MISWPVAVSTRASRGSVTLKRNLLSLSKKRIVPIGRCWASYGVRRMRVSCAASFALSKSGVFVFLTGSTIHHLRPAGVSNSYQKRSLNSSQCGETAVEKTYLPTLADVHRAARS
ncbi:hypothetical protein D3C83_28180 [compost metagenome]